MITAIEIENFKAFGERQRIELRPITLLFGPNSGGKSSVCHALHYLREVICEGNLDAHRTWSGGDSLDLGGATNLVHGRRVGNTIRIKTEFLLNGAELPDYQWYDLDFGSGMREEFEERIRGLIYSASVEIEVSAQASPVLRAVRVGLNGEPVAELWMPPDRPHVEIRSINWLNPVLMRDEAERAVAERHAQLVELERQREIAYAADPKSPEFIRLTDERKKLRGSVGDIPGELAELYRSSGGQVAGDTVIIVPANEGRLPAFDRRLEIPLDSAPGRSGQFEFQYTLSMLLMGPVCVLRERLKDLRYVGPLRAMPPRHIEARETAGRSRWASGVQAWESLAHGADEMLEETGRWLESSERLDTGYRLEREKFKQVPVSIAAMLVNPEFAERLETFGEEIRALPEQTRIVLRDVGRNLLLHPRDVGVGLSQLVPVIVALLEPGAAVVAMEQPELHLHPRQQAALGDALIASMAVNPRRVLLVETHSEHMILRLLRRIRETTAGESGAETQLRPGDVSVVYIQPQGTNATVTSIPVTDDGDFTQLWPNGFFAERVKELL